MHLHRLSRRAFLQTAAIGLTASAAGVSAASRLADVPAWTIGCLNRPWTKWSADEMLDAIKAAGFRVIGLQTPTPNDPFAGPTATPDYLRALKDKIAARDLTAIQGRLRTTDTAPFAEATADIRKQVNNAKTLGLRVLINTGTMKPELYEGWYKLMAFAAAYGADHGIQIVTKPHGGVVGTGADLLRALEKVNHPNFSVWYDAGNIIHYTGLDPVAELEPIMNHVSAFTGKDSTGKGGEVMIQFGRGKVDFPAVFRRLKRGGFAGPIMIESCAIGATPAETGANAKANREFLEQALRQV